MQPYEIVAAPFEVWIATFGTAMPLVDSTPAVPWALLGTSGSKNHTDAGVSVAHSQTVNTFTPAGSTTPRKAWRTGEEMVVSLSIADLTLETYSKIMDSVAITTTAATTSPVHSGYKSMPLYRGVTVNLYALLVKGASPYDEAKSCQYELPAVYEAGNPTLTFSKQNPVELAVEFHVFEATAGIFGTFRAQTTP